MNSMKMLFLTLQLFCAAGLHFSVAAMEVVSYRNSWQQNLAGLNDATNWDTKGFPTNQWMSAAVESAVNAVEKTEITSQKIMGDFRKELSKRYVSPQENDKIYSIEIQFLEKFNQELDKKLHPLDEQKMEAKRIKKEEFSKKERAQQQLILEEIAQSKLMAEQARKRERAKVKRTDSGWETELGLFSKNLLNLSFDVNWYRDNSIKQEWMENSVPTQEWMKNAAQSASELINAGKVTPNEVIRHLGDALWHYYSKKKSDKSFINTIERVQKRFIDLLNKSIVVESPKPKYVREEPSKQKQPLILLNRSEQKQIKNAVVGVVAIQELQQEALLHSLEESQGPKQEWQNKICDLAIRGINAEINNKKQRIKDIFYAISTAIDNYTKTLWFPDKKAMTIAKYTMFKNIDAATTGDFQNFMEYCYVVANSDVTMANVSEVAFNNPTIHWIFNQIKTYFDLNPMTKKAIAAQAAMLIKNNNIPIAVIEYAMNKELQDARKGKSPKFRSAQGLSLMKAIKEELAR